MAMNNHINHLSRKEPEKKNNKNIIDKNILQSIIMNPLDMQKTNQFMNMASSSLDLEFQLSCKQISPKKILA